MSLAHISLQRIPSMTEMTFPMQFRHRIHIIVRKTNATSLMRHLAHLLDAEFFIVIGANAAPCTVHDALSGTFPFMTVLAPKQISFCRSRIFLRKTFPALVLRRFAQSLDAIGQAIIDALLLGVALPTPASPDDFGTFGLPLMAMSALKAVITIRCAVRIGETSSPSLRSRLLQPLQAIDELQVFAMRDLRASSAPTAPPDDVGSTHFPFVAVGAHKAMRDSVAEIPALQAFSSLGFCGLL